MYNELVTNICANGMLKLNPQDKAIDSTFKMSIF